MVKVGLIQMSCVDENNPEPNMEKALRLIDEAAGGARCFAAAADAAVAAATAVVVAAAAAAGKNHPKKKNLEKYQLKNQKNLKLV